MELNDNSLSSVDQSLDEIIQLKDNCEIKNTNSSLYDFLTIIVVKMKMTIMKQ